MNRESQNNGMSQIEINPTYANIEEYRLAALKEQAEGARTDGTFELSYEAKNYILDNYAEEGNYGDVNLYVTFLPLSWESESGLYMTYFPHHSTKESNGIIISKMNLNDVFNSNRNNPPSKVLEVYIEYVNDVISLTSDVTSSIEFEKGGYIIKASDLLKDLIVNYDTRLLIENANQKSVAQNVA